MLTCNSSLTLGYMDLNDTSNRAFVEERCAIIYYLPGDDKMAEEIP